jgi:hypothetical protein
MDNPQTRRKLLLKAACVVIPTVVAAAAAIALSESPPLEDVVTSPLSTPKAIWTTDDESALIAFLIEHKSKAGDGTNFKSSVWNAAVEEMAKYSTKGGPKSANSCKSKWTQVCSSILAECFCIADWFL